MTAWRWALVGALATIAIAMTFGMVPGIGACGPSNGIGQWASFQTITSVGEVEAMFRLANRGACVPALMVSMKLDALAFIPAFTLLLAANVIALRPPRWLLIGSLTALAGGAIADQLEGISLLTILHQLPGTEAMVDNVVAAHFAKKLLLALATAGAGLSLILSAGWHRWAGVMVVLGAGAALANVFGAYSDGTAGLLVSWLMLAAVAFSGAVAEWRSRAAMALTAIR